MRQSPISSILFPLTIFIMVFLNFVPMGVGQFLKSAKIIEIGMSRRNFYLDAGEREGLKIGDRARFYIQLPDTGQNQKTIFIGLGEVKKSADGSSLWHMTKLVEKDYLVYNHRVIYVVLDNYMKARKRWELRRKHKILSSNSPNSPNSPELREKKTRQNQYKEKVRIQKGPPDSANTEDQTRAGTRVNPEANQFDQMTQSSWNYLNERHTFQNSTQENLGPNVNSEQLNDYFFDQELAAVLGGSINKSDQEDSETFWNELYVLQKKDPVNEEFKEEMSLQSTYAQVKFNQKERLKTYKTVIEDLKAKGPTWSDGLDDQQLRQYVEKKGIILEDLKQKVAFEQSFSHELAPSFFLPLSDHSTFTREKSYAFSLQYEYFLKNYHSHLENFSFSSDFRIGQNNFQLNENEVALVKEKSVLLSIGYYPLNIPTVVRTPVFAVGVGLRLGYGDINLLYDPSKSYPLVSFPSFWVKLKFRFNDNFGFYSGFFSDALRFSNFKQGEVNGSSVALYALDFKLGFGLTFYF